MTDEQRKALTLYLGECWHEAEKRYVNLGGMNTEVPMWICKHCGDGSTSSDISWAKHRTFTTDADMMALYRRIEKDGKWDDFVKHTNAKWGENAALYMVVEEAIADYIAWLFCLNGKNYEDLCKMVAEFYGLEGEK